MDIRTALARLTTIQAGLAITSPVALSVKRAWTTTPPQTAALADVPAWTNDVTLLNVERDSGLRIIQYEVHSQLYVYDASEDRAADIALAFLTAYIDALDADVSLANTVTQQNLRGNAPTLVTITWNDRRYIGLDLVLWLEMKEAKVFS